MIIREIKWVESESIVLSGDTSVWLSPGVNTRGRCPEGAILGKEILEPDNFMVAGRPADNNLKQCWAGAGK